MSRVVTGTVRLSYANIWEPKSINGSDPKYSCSIIVPKSDTKTVEAIKGAIEDALQEGAPKFGGKIPPRGALKLPLRDGDTERDDEAYRNSWFINANAKADRPPKVVDRNVQPIFEHSEIYSGVYAKVALSFYAFNTSGNKGVACGLEAVQKIRDGEPLGSTVKAESLFTKVQDDEDDDLGL